LLNRATLIIFTGGGVIVQEDCVYSRQVRSRICIYRPFRSVFEVQKGIDLCDIFNSLERRVIMFVLIRGLVVEA
jgi:hypothetical protein